MLLWKKTPAPARAGAGLWWQPKKIAVCKISQSYYTVENPSCKDLAKYLNDEKLTVAVSPEDVDGKIWYIAFDVDSGRRSNLESIYNTIEKLIGDKPHVSRSGGKGWHVWLFPDKPLEKKRPGTGGICWVGHLLRALNRSLVEKVFGKEFASGIFRRSPEK